MTNSPQIKIEGIGETRRTFTISSRMRKIVTAAAGPKRAASNFLTDCQELALEFGVERGARVQNGDRGL
jgi:hypothetical protein